MHKDLFLILVWFLWLLEDFSHNLLLHQNWSFDDYNPQGSKERLLLSNPAMTSILQNVTHGVVSTVMQNGQTAVITMATD